MDTDTAFTQPPPSPDAPPWPGPSIGRREPILRIPPVTFWLIAVNVVVHIVLGFLPPGQEEVVINTLGFDPATLRQPITALGVASLITFQFLHGGWDHLGFNMLSLLAFGSGVERAIGRVRYLIFYLSAGIAGALLQGIFTPAGEDGVLIGASAGISGLFGVLLALWNFNTPGGGAIRILPMAILWIGLITVTGILGVGAQGMAVAWIAHIGGFLAGLGYGLIIRQRRPS